jgi:hypothetical protein
MRRIVILAVSVLSFSAAKAAPIYNLPIELFDATFSDGTAFSGVFTLNAYGYMGGGYLRTAAGVALDGATAMGAYLFIASPASNELSASPAAPDVLQAHGSASPYLINITFDHSLGTPGMDPFVIDAAYLQNPNSAECYPYACYNYGPVDAPSKERLVATGYAYVPEPVSAALFGTALLGLGAARRRGKTLPQRIKALGITP